MDGLGDNDLLFVGGVERHEDGLGQSGRAVIERCVGHLHAGQLAHHGLVFKNSGQRALAGLGLVRGIGRIEFAPSSQVVHHGRDKVVVTARAQERRGVGDIGIFVCQFGQ